MAASQNPAQHSAVRSKRTGSIKSDFAILDVKAGRAALHKMFAKRPRLGVCPFPLRIPVTIKGYIDGVWSRDDGVSREFSITVQSVTTKKRGASR